MGLYPLCPLCRCGIRETCFGCYKCKACLSSLYELRPVCWYLFTKTEEHHSALGTHTSFPGCSEGRSRDYLWTLLLGVHSWLESELLTGSVLCSFSELSRSLVVKPEGLWGDEQNLVFWLSTWSFHTSAPAPPWTLSRDLASGINSLYSPAIGFFLNETKLKLWHWHNARETLRKFSQTMFPTCLGRKSVGAEETHL